MLRCADIAPLSPKWTAMPAATRFRAVLACLAIVLSVPADAQPVLECSGPFRRDADEAALIHAFGAGNVVRDDIDIGEMTTEPGAVIFPKDAKRRIEVLWHDIDERRQPRSITVREGSTWTFAAMFPDQRRITVGTPLAQVEAINGRPFLINGFGWDLGGYAVDWKGGALARTGSACRLTIRFDPEPKTRDQAQRNASGGRRFPSSSPVMRAVKPIVSSIALEWPQ